MAVGNNSSFGQSPGSPFNAEFFTLLDKLQVARFSIFSFVFILGIWGNVMVIATIFITKRLRSSSNYFIANLAVADLGGLCIAMPLALMGQVIDWPFGAIVCRFLNPIKDLFLHVSFITLTAIAVDRYVHTAFPFRPHLSIYKVKLIIVLMWLVDYLMVPLPMGFVMKVERNPFTGYNVCMAKFSPEIRKTTILLLGGFVFLSVFLTASAYLGVGIAMLSQRVRIKKRAQGPGLQDKAFRRQLEKNAKTVKLMMVIVLAFWITVLPLTLFGVLLELKLIQLDITQYVTSLFIVMHLLFLQHCINPLILYVLSKEMRAGFAACSECCWGKKPPAVKQNGRRASQREIVLQTQQPKPSTATKPTDQNANNLEVNGIAKMYSINNDNQRGPTVQV